MTYVSRYSHDVFISYAHQDQFPAGKVWALAFRNALEATLRMRMGVRSDSPDYINIFFDTTRGLEGGDDIQRKLLESAHSSAIFIPIVSPSYCSSDWARRELRAYAAENDGGGNIIPVEILP